MVTQPLAKQMHAKDVRVQILPRIMPRLVSRNWMVHSTAHVEKVTPASSATSVLMDILGIH